MQNVEKLYVTHFRRKTRDRTATIHNSTIETTPKMNVSWKLMEVLQTRFFMFYENKYFSIQFGKRVNENFENINFQSKNRFLMQNEEHFEKN